MSIYKNKALEKIGESINLARKARLLTQEHLAETIHVSIPTIKKIESGDGSVSILTYFSAIEALSGEKALKSLIQSLSIVENSMTLPTESSQRIRVRRHPSLNF